MCTWLSRILSVVVLPLAFAVPISASQGTSSLAPAVRMLSSTSGSKGEVRGGRYVILDPRTTFRIPDDTKVVVSFQWLGTPGKHHLQATWHGPRDVSSTSGFDYTAPSREFGAYWQLTLSADAPLGQWTLDALVDGQPAGSHMFELVGPGAPAPTISPAAPLPLTRQELYARALAATVTVQALDETGRVLNTTAGGLLDSQTVITIFAAIDGAAKLRVRAGSAAPVEISEVLAFNRRQNWVALRVMNLSGVQPQVPAKARPGMGAQCTSASPTSDGSFVATYGEVVGTRDYPSAGARLNVSFHSGDAGAGAPVFDEFGGLVGIAGAATEPVVIRRTYRIGDMMTEASQVLVLPIDLVHADGNVVTPLSELKARGLFMMPITLPGQVLSGGFAAGILRAGPRTQPVDERDHFSKQEKHVSTFVTWDAKRTIKGLVVLRVYDIDNRLLGETKPMKVTLRPGDLSLSSWEFDVPSVTGTYRVDLLVGPDIVWRGFFDVTD